MDHDCISLENESLRLEIARSIGPRILGLSLGGHPNLLAELPGAKTVRPDGKTYRFYGGHRLWQSPEDALLSYELEDDPVEIVPIANGLNITKPVDAESGIQKSIQVVLPDNRAKAVITHQLKNCGKRSVRCAPWAITQFRTGGMAILPMNNADTGFLPNRNLVLWSYTDLADRNVQWGQRYIRVNAAMKSPFKIGFPNPVGWLAYWLEGVLFVKSAGYDSHASYPDFGSSSEFYCNQHFVELETLAPLAQIEPGDSVTHVETWTLYPGIPFPENDHVIRTIMDDIGLK